jgi:hypothetical protein
MENDNGKTTNSRSKWKIGLTAGLAIIAMLPSLGIGLWICGIMVKDLWVYLSVNNVSDRLWIWYGLLLNEIYSSASWLVPFLLGVITIGFLLRRRKMLGFVVGGFTISISYLLLWWKLEKDIEECSKTQPMCGEWSFLELLLYATMCATDLLALIGFMVLADKVQPWWKRKSNALTRNQADVKILSQ